MKSVISFLLCMISLMITIKKFLNIMLFIFHVLFVYKNTVIGMTREINVNN